VDSLPDLTGQPAWVIVVVVGLTALGTLASAVVQRGERRRKRQRSKDNDDDPTVGDRQRVPSLPSGDAHVLGVSVQALVDTARHERREAEEARAETRDVRARYEQAMRELGEARRTAERALVDLAHCQDAADRLRKKLNGGDRL
jgi:Flp pilus assembly protein TadB